MRKLTAKQNSFIENYCNPNSDTFNNATNSALRAGYGKVTARKACQDIVAKRRVVEAMKAYKDEFYQKQAITIEYIQQEHQRLALLAEENGDLATATRNKELLGKTIAAYTDKQQQTGEGLTINVGVKEGQEQAAERPEGMSKGFAADLGLPEA